MNTILHALTPRRLVPALVALLLAVGATACDFIDPTEVDNPRTTDEDLTNAEEPTKALLPGLRAQFARAVGAVVTTTENVSDDYSIHGTGLDKQLDFPRQLTANVLNSTGTSTGAYWNLQELLALSDFLLDVIVPEDENATPAQIAEATFYRGMGLLMLSENFSAAPREQDGEPVPAAELLSRAVSALQSVASGSSELQVPAQAALARAYRWQGDAAQARSAAESVLAADPAFLFQQEYDGSSIENNPFVFLFLRQLQEMQPLPRLDFLDPKYTARDAGIAVAKAEEMHLILAEADLAAGSFESGRDHLVDALEVARSRGTVDFIDNDFRSNADLTIRPRDPEILVRADPDAPFRAGLVLPRPDVEIEVPPVSGTSLDPDSIAQIPATATDELWHSFWLARQEILFLEGRRMADLGIRLPIMLREIDANPSIELGDPGTEVVVPAYIPPDDQMDLFTPASPYDAEENLVETEITILVDMNDVLRDNGASPFGG